VIDDPVHHGIVRLEGDDLQTPQWIKKLGGHAGELYVAAELSKRGIPNSLFPENFSDETRKNVDKMT
jgi:hypothetical protein